MAGGTGQSSEASGGEWGMVPDAVTVWTVGHSNRSAEQFLALLAENSIEAVVDVRKLPGSARYPQFDADALAQSLGAAGIRFRRAAELTGRRPVSREVPFEVNGWWRNRSFHNYADHAMSDAFADALERLRTDAQEQRIAVMCAEAVWWRCHRRIIADHVIARGDRVVHIMGPQQAVPAQLSSGAVIGGRSLTYPACDDGAEFGRNDD